MTTNPPLSFFADSPIANLEVRHVDDLVANAWNPNCVLDQELALLERSLLKTKWLQPILINPNNIIIDGFHRWSLSKNSVKVREVYKGYVPVAILNVPDWEAMMITVRINRAKGSHVAFRMSEIVTKLINEYGVPREEVAAEMGATKDEIDLLLHQDVFRMKDIQNHKYSKAWVPAPGTDKVAEAPAEAAPVQ